MKKIIIFIFLLFLFPSVNADAKELTITLENETVSFSAEGYMPKAKCDKEEILSEITYFAIDTSNSSPVEFPINSPGTYQIFAKFEGNSEYEATETSALITIEPVEAKIIANYNKVAYSRMENPVKYSVEPAWAKDYLDISIDYYPIESMNSHPNEKISAPVDLGLYYTIINATSKTAGIVCENKYMVYEIAAYKGKKLSSAEREASVPSNFKCTFENTTAVYEKGASVSCKYTLYPAAISGNIFYRCIYADGTYSQYTKNPPTEPGEYESSYFLGNTCIGTGKIFIDKKTVSIKVENDTIEYIQGGIIPRATCDDDNAEITFTAFVIDELGSVTLEEVPVPINKCGKFSIIAYPKDTEHYNRIYSYGQIEITQATPIIEITESSFVCDGKEKNISFKTTPENLLYTVEYYLYDDKNNTTPFDTPPSNVGKYKAIIKVYDNEGNYVPTEKIAFMDINENFESQAIMSPLPSEKTSSIFKIVILSLIGTAFIATLIIFAVSTIKKKKASHE